MNDFEVRYNAGELAHFAVQQQIIKELAKLQGDNSATWLKQFEESAVESAGKVKLRDGSGQNPAITDVAQSIIRALSQSAAKKAK